MGGGSAPILTEYFESNYRMIDASKLAVGKKVEVNGSMIVFWATAPKGASRWGDANVRRVPQKPLKPGEHVLGEHIIIVKGKPKILSD
jgi:hypothetical protein